MIILKVTLLAAALAAAAPTWASSAPPGNVSNPWAASSGAFMFDLSSDKTALPGCAGIQNVPHRWAINSSTAAGQAMISIVLNAYAQHKQIAVSGTHGCDVWSDTETVWYLQITN